MIGRFKYELLPAYAHLSEAETEIWNRFVQKYPEFCERCNYDVVVGDLPAISENIKEEWQRNAEYLGRYKIDVVGYKGKKHFIIECKQRAGPGALGQLIAYMSMYQDEVGPDVDAEPVLITDIERPNIRALCEEHDIEYYVV